MAEDREQVVAENTADPRDGPFGGERLAEARRELQISVIEVAKELHLDETKVRALEQNDFDTLGAAVFAKGHLRKYAEIVGIDPADVLADYYKMTHTADLPPVVSNRPKLRQELSPGPWVAALAVLVVAAAAYWWFVLRPVAPVPGPEPQTESPAQPVTDTPPPADEPEITESDEAAAGVDLEATGEPAAEPAAAAPETETDAAVADGQIRLSVTFSGDCWTEISDADGRRLFFEMGRDGRTVDLTGTAPVSILFGNVENVSLRVDGSDYPVVPANPGSRTARLTIVRP